MKRHRVGADPQARARKAIQILEEAILDVLYEGMENKEGMGPKGVTEKTGLSSGDYDGQHKYWLAFGFLSSLMAQGKVHKPERGHYELTEEELAKRRPDIQAPNY